MLDFVLDTYRRLISEQQLETHRSLYEHFNLNNRLTGLVGPRGVGKTTLLLQYIKQHLYQDKSTIYFSADLMYFNQVSLLEFVTELYQYAGYKYYFIDEIHKYHNWNQELKNIYDAFPDIKIVFSGSSMLDLVKGSYDLSRRAKLYHLPGLSFREYLGFVTGHSLTPVNYQDLLSANNKLDQELQNFRGLKGHFVKYLETGYYPFAFEDKHSYFERVSRVIEKTIYEDIANFYNLKTPNLHVSPFQL